MNNRWKVVVALVLLVLMSAIGLRGLATSTSASDAPVVVAHGGGPVPPPWSHGGGPVPPPWNHGGGPVPPPWK
jgi:hypothetical protein